MIKSLRKILIKNRLWISVIAALNLLFGILLWLSNEKAFIYVFPTMIIGSLILYSATAFVIYKNDLKREEAINNFLNEPTIDKENEIIGVFHFEEAKLIRNIGEVLREKKNIINTLNQGINDYEEYVEGWAHQIKTPLALMTFILDNRKDEISLITYKRLQYVRTKIQEDVERMLYYARLKSTSSDYIYKELSLRECCVEVLEEYTEVLKEKDIEVNLEVFDYIIASDKRGLEFIIRQIISNSIKYTDSEIEKSKIIITAEDNKDNIKLKIRDNGIGIKSYDLPFIFQKGFTGEIGEQRKNSTGMGLYLAKRVSEGLKIELYPNDKY
ncbi:MAG: sensor histidine kinase, partial [Clostridium sp.]